MSVAWSSFLGSSGTWTLNKLDNDEDENHYEDYDVNDDDDENYDSFPY